MFAPDTSYHYDWDAQISLGSTDAARSSTSTRLRGQLSVSSKTEESDSQATFIVSTCSLLTSCVEVLNRRCKLTWIKHSFSSEYFQLSNVTVSVQHGNKSTDHKYFTVREFSLQLVKPFHVIYSGTKVTSVGNNSISFISIIWRFVSGSRHRVRR